MTIQTKQSYINDNLLVVPTKYDDLYFYVDTPSFSSLKVDSGIEHDISEKIRELKVVTANNCELIGRFCDDDLTLTINRKEYHNVKVEIDICTQRASDNRKIQRFYVKANTIGRYTMHSDLTKSAREKLEATLLEAIEPALEQHLTNLVEIQVKEAYQTMRLTLVEHQTTVNNAIAHFDLLANNDEIDLLKQELKEAIGDSVDTQAVDELSSVSGKTPALQRSAYAQSVARRDLGLKPLRMIANLATKG